MEPTAGITLVYTLYTVQYSEQIYHAIFYMTEL